MIETVIIYKLPRLSREEIQAMLQVHDIRETRVYQEAKEEGIEEGARQEKIRSISRMTALGISPDEIARYLGLDVEFVRAEIAKSQS